MRNKLIKCEMLRKLAVKSRMDMDIEKKMPNILKHFFAETKMSMSNYTRDEFPNRDFVKFDSKLFEYVLLAVNN